MFAWDRVILHTHKHVHTLKVTVAYTTPVYLGHNMNWSPKTRI